MSIRIKMFLTLLAVSLLPAILLIAITPNFLKLILAPSGAAFLIILFAIIVLVALSSILISIYFTLPIIELRMVAQRTKSGQSALRARIHSDDEVGDLGVAFNSMLDTIQSQLKDLGVAKAKDESILSAIGDGLVAVDKEGKALFVNKAFEALVGWNEKEVIGKKIVDVVPRENEAGKQISTEQRAITQALTGAAAAADVSATWYYVRKDKTRFPVSAIASPMRVDGQIIGAVEVFRDITQEKQIDRSKSEFVSLASHQLRTPPSIVKWYVELLLKSPGSSEFSDKQKMYINQIKTAGDRMVILVNTLLSVSRLELGTFKAKNETVDTVKVAKDVLSELDLSIKAKKLQIKEIYEDKLPTIQADKGSINIIFQNLLSNAVKYTRDSGKIIIKLASDKDKLIITVEDNGYGIPSDQQSKIFTKLFRGYNVAAQDTQGNGLGLYIVKSILKQMKGVISFSSVENKGTTFTVTIPIK